MDIKPIFALIILLLLPAGACDVPGARFDEISHDFGRVERNRELRHVFRFTNTGAATLIIREIHAG